jgi:hypothetical protein
MTVIKLIGALKMKNNIIDIRTKESISKPIPAAENMNNYKGVCILGACTLVILISLFAIKTF